MTVLELFAGGGGAAMGLHRASLHTLARCEWDKDACATLRAAADAGYLDAADVIEGDIRAVDWSPYVGRVDALWASPPCQAWSSAGKRLGAADDRNGWPWTFDVVDTVRPTWLLAENVTGLLMHRGDCDGKGVPDLCPGCYFHRHILPEARKRFASVQWAELNSSAFGVPQHRRRVYLVCGPSPIAWPVETHGDPAEIRQRGMFAAPLLPWMTVREALSLDGTLTHKRSLTDDCWKGTWSPTYQADQPARTQSASPHSILDNDHPRAKANSIIYRRGREGGAVAAPVDVPAGTVPKSGNQYLHASDPGVRNGPASRPELLDSPMDTLTGGSPLAHTNGRSILSASAERREAYSAAGIRRLTVTECALLMAWPADYPLQGTKTSQYRIVGNGCTPHVVEFLALAMLRQHHAAPISGTPTPPR
jgi:DNA-cytosine methyltransferase